MKGDNIEPYWEEDRRTCYLVDEYVDRTTMELTSEEAVDFQEFLVSNWIFRSFQLLEHYGMLSGNI